MIIEEMPQFQTDYLISWDLSDHDFPTVTVMGLQKSEDGKKVEAHHLGTSHSKAGAISLRQILVEKEREEWLEKERSRTTTEVKHGHWKDNNNGTFTCSVCGGKASKMAWCGHCGAKMDEVTKE